MGGSPTCQPRLIQAPAPVSYKSAGSSLAINAQVHRYRGIVCDVCCVASSLLPALNQTPLSLGILGHHTTPISMASSKTPTSKSDIATPQLDVALPTVTNRQSGNNARPNTVRATTRAARRRGKLDGPFQLRFLTATDPTQFKDGETRRSVRSQAMRYHRNKINNSDAAPRERPETVPPLYTEPIVGDQVGLPTTQAQLLPPERTPRALVPYGYDQQTYIHVPTTRSPKEASGAEAHDAAFERRWSTRSGRRQSTSFHKVVQYEYTESQEERKIRLFATTFSRIGDEFDPFKVLPQFENPSLNSGFILRACRWT